LAADIAIGSAPPERAGAASGLSETSSELGGALGITVLGTIGTGTTTAASPLFDGTPPSCCAQASVSLDLQCSEE